MKINIPNTKAIATARIPKPFKLMKKGQSTKQVSVSLFRAKFNIRYMSEWH